jgi:hypothetical protein
MSSLNSVVGHYINIKHLIDTILIFLWESTPLYGGTVEYEYTELFFCKVGYSRYDILKDILERTKEHT